MDGKHLTAFLNLFDPEDRNRDTPKLTAPLKVGSFSETDGGDDPGAFFDDDRLMRVLTVPMDKIRAPRYKQRFDFDLLDGYTSMNDGGWRPCDSTNYTCSGLYNILQWIKAHQSSLSNADRPVNYDFVAKNGTLARIMNAANEKRNGWCIGAARFRGTVYLYNIITDDRRRGDANRSEHENKTSYGGFRFEKHISELAASTGQGEDNQSHGEHYIILSAEMGKFHLLYSSEMDSLTDPSLRHDAKPHDFLEIKTALSRQGERRLEGMYRWWAQTYLNGASGVLVGNRDPDYHVRSVELINKEEMPYICRAYWSSRDSLLFLDRFLAFVWETVAEDDPDIMYEFKWSAGQNSVSVLRKKPQPERCVIPEWYIDWLQSVTLQ